MKKRVLFFAIIVFSFISCRKDTRDNSCDCVPPPTAFSTCLQKKIDTFIAANADYTSIKRYRKGTDIFVLFDNGAAFDAPQYMLNWNCDTVCTWSFRANALPCQQDFNLNDSTAVVIWKK
jgi:hypothetical protein